MKVLLTYLYSKSNKWHYHPEMWFPVQAPKKKLNDYLNTQWLKFQLRSFSLFIFQINVIYLSFYPKTYLNFPLITSGRSHEALACIIEKLSGKTFYEYLNENIFAPLGMKHLRFKLDCNS